MNLEKELERLTAPPLRASEVRRLHQKEIVALVLKREVAPVSAIPERHICGSETTPRKVGRDSYVY